MLGIYDMTPWSIRTAVTPDIVKIMKNLVFYKMVYKTLYFGWSIPEKLRYKVKFSIFKKKKPKKALALKGLREYILTGSNLHRRMSQT